MSTFYDLDLGLIFIFVLLLMLTTHDILFLLFDYAFFNLMCGLLGHVNKNIYMSP